MNKLRKAIFWAEHNLIGKSFKHPEISKPIHFSRQGVRHALRARTNDLKIDFIYELPSILKKAILIDETTDRKGRPDIKVIYKLFVRYCNKGNDYFVYITAREGVNGVIYYDNVLLKQKQH
ncbi:hypothetical protein [Lentimicrobium sp. S6]|uniref:LPD3 domain-containing protein n=1 Tax=Lentimicrobium sp. S6 TaxID=2735872 RepID=UPI001551D6C1|nr:hypothetical protein [Lentimicrobium sp. S6]NPD47479.1 hypothetical protein [Lentimicrobium sp. S6]